MTRRSVLSALVTPALFSEALRAMEDRFPIQYEDFPEVGLVLMGRSAPDYEALVSQIKARSLPTAGPSDDGGLEKLEDRSKSVVFFNKSEKPVVLLQVLWRFALPDGLEIAGSCAWAGGEILLLPFGLTAEVKPVMKYRAAILAGSKRYITNTGAVVGDNSDVRPPSAEETWNGGAVNGFGGAYGEPRQPVRLSICVEGAFFDDGTFAGTDGTKLFERIVAKAEAHAKIAEMAGQKGKSAGAVLDEIQKSARELKAPRRIPLIPDANIPVSVYGDVAFRNLAENVERYRASQGDAGALETIRSWANAEIPALRKLNVAVRKSIV